jgi:hypothetical protein
VVHDDGAAIEIGGGGGIVRSHGDPIFEGEKGAFVGVAAAVTTAAAGRGASYKGLNGNKRVETVRKHYVIEYVALYIALYCHIVIYSVIVYI